MNQPRTVAVVATILLLGGAGCRSCQQYGHRTATQCLENVSSDAAYYYSGRGCARLAAGLGVGATLAHTPADRELRDWWQNDVRSGGTDNFATGVKQLGEGKYMIPLALATMATGELLPELPATAISGDWGGRTSRAYLTGAPPMLMAQWMTGASRPGESNRGSDWAPFEDTNGVSGHSFIGAVPWITAAQMAESPYLKASLYAGSTLAGWSRINDDAHYSSQVVLGWWMAYLAADAVNNTEVERRSYHCTPVMLPEGVGVGVVLER